MPKAGKNLPQGKYWMLTIPAHMFTPYLPPGCVFIQGQLEQGGTTGYLHWQVVVCFKSKVRRKPVQDVFGKVHCELTKSDQANVYCVKDESAVAGTRFSLGEVPFQRNKSDHWEAIRGKAKSGILDEIDPQIYVCHYRTLKAIAVDHMVPVAIERSCFIFWGVTGSGKSRRAWDEAGLDAFPKDPKTKFWDGYRGHKHVVFDEFDGSIDICHMLRWLDRYPVIVEVKGSSVVLRATTIWITSNVDPRLWYPFANDEQKAALMRRCVVTQFVL